MGFHEFNPCIVGVFYVGELPTRFAHVKGGGAIDGEWKPCRFQFLAQSLHVTNVPADVDVTQVAPEAVFE